MMASGSSPCTLILFIIYLSLIFFIHVFFFFFLFFFQRFCLSTSLYTCIVCYSMNCISSIYPSNFHSPTFLLTAFSVVEVILLVKKKKKKGEDKNKKAIKNVHAKNLWSLNFCDEKTICQC